MVRTKPTARKSTGGNAPRKRLSFKVSLKATKAAKKQQTRQRLHGSVASSSTPEQPQQAEIEYIDEILRCFRHAVNAEEAEEQMGLSDEALFNKHILDSAKLFYGATLVQARFKKLKADSDKVEEKTLSLMKKVEILEAQLISERTENEERMRSAEEDFKAKLDALEASHREEQSKAVESFKSSIEFEGLQFEQFCSGYMLCRDEIRERNPDWDLAFLTEDTIPNNGKKRGAS